MALTKIQTAGITDGTVGADDLASTLDLSSKTVTLPEASVTAHVTAFDDNQLKEEIALLGFKVAANGSLSKYNLVDQIIDSYEDASGVDAGGSSDEVRNLSNYYSIGVPVTVSGNYDSSGVDGDYTWYKWTTVTSSGSFTTDAAQDYEYLVVAGGGSGGGGQYLSGGGGAGGFRTATGFAITASTITGITVGAGGAAQSGGSMGADGGNSVFSTITSTGGGGGSNYMVSGGRDGGSGGGGGGSANYTPGSGIDDGGTFGTVTYQGHDGGIGMTTGAGAHGAGGGGGAGAAGGAGTSSVGGDGGAGRASTITGSSVMYAGGGGGSAYDGGGGTAGAGGSGGGGAGSTGDATSGTASTGGGGGGAERLGSYTSGAGGSGIVIIKRPTGPSPSVSSMTLISNATTAEATPTKGDIVMTYTNGAGTATVNTDLKAYVSRDDGTTWTQLTLASQGSTGAHTILSAHDLDISGQPSGTAMRYKITTHNQSVTKETRVHAVSLGWS